MKIDKSGLIDFSEFLIAISVTAQGDARKKLILAFKMYDVDRNGSVDKKEMRKIIEAIYDLLGEELRKGDNSPTERVKTIMNKLDKDNSGNLSQDEFVEGKLLKINQSTSYHYKYGTVNTCMSIQHRIQNFY